VKPTWIWLENPGSRTVLVTHGQDGASACCDIINRDVAIAPGARVGVAASYNGPFGARTRAFVQVGRWYWLVFDNAPLRAPEVTASEFGPPLIRPNLPPLLCCGRGMPAALLFQSMDVYQTISITMSGHVFGVRRDPDMTNYLAFTVTLPATL
jgi:hypothetical protein